MQRYFLYIFIFILAFAGCDINGLQVVRYYDVCLLLVFLSVSFMLLNLIGVCEGKAKNIFIGKSELFLFLFLAWSAATFYFSVNVEATIFPAMKSLGAIAFGVGLFLYLEKRGQLVQIWLVSYIFACIHASLGVIEQSFLLHDKLLSFAGWNGSLFSNPNYFSCYLLLHIPIGIYLYFKNPISFSKTLIGLGWIIILIALWLSTSQAAILIAAMQIGVSVIYFLVHKKPKRAILVSVSSLVSYLIFFNLINLTTGANNYSPLTIMSSPGSTVISSPFIEEDWLLQHVGIRLRLWVGAWRIFSENWLLGSGLWTYNEIYPYTGLLKVVGDPFNILPPHAHSLYLQTAAETGLIGIALLSSCLFFIFRNNIKLLIEKKRTTLDLNFFLLTSAVGFLIHNISEYNWLNSLFTYYFVLLCVSMGYLGRVNSLQAESLISFRKIFLLPSILLFSLVLGFTQVKFYKYYQILFKPIDLKQTMVEYETELNRAKNLCERCARPRYLSGLAKYDRYRLSKKTEFLNEAQKEFSAAVDRNPYNPKINMLQGDIYTLQEKNKEARKSYEMAMKHGWFALPARKKIKHLENSNKDLEP